jgi:hypothetical protein
MVDKTKVRAYTVYTMKLITTIAAIATILLTGCATVGSVVFKDPRCQPRQYCPYTDAPPAIRSEPVRSSNTYAGDPAAR